MLKPNTTSQSPSRHGTLFSGLSVEAISAVLGFAPNMPASSDGKVKHHWQWKDTERGGVHAIWDYKGGHWSIGSHGFQGCREYFASLFPACLVASHGMTEIYPGTALERREAIARLENIWDEKLGEAEMAGRESEDRSANLATSPSLSLSLTAAEARLLGLELEARIRDHKEDDDDQTDEQALLESMLEKLEKARDASTRGAAFPLFHLVCTGGAGISALSHEMHASSEAEAIRLAERNCQDVALSGRYWQFSLWQGERLVDSWQAQPEIKIERFGEWLAKQGKLTP